jgi:hypothetical protein
MGERLSRSGLMPRAWEALGAQRNRRVNKSGLAVCKVLAVCAVFEQGRSLQLNCV